MSSMTTKNKRFFIPFVGSEYSTGINGKKVLVLGASFYCLKEDCDFYRECTSYVKKDSSTHNYDCPCKDGDELRNQPTDTPNNRVYSTFIKSLQQLIEIEVDAWERVAFTNYVQFYVPTQNTYEYYLSDRDFEAFIETVKELQPDVVVVWGAVINKPIRDSTYVINKREVIDTGGYLWHLEGIPEVNHRITVVNCYHPSSIRYWYQDIDIFMGYLRQALEIE